MNNYQNLVGKTENISVQCWQCSAILFWNGSYDCSVHTTSEDGSRLEYSSTDVPVHLICVLPVRIKGVNRMAKSSPPKVFSKFSSLPIETLF